MSALTVCPTPSVRVCGAPLQRVVCETVHWLSSLVSLPHSVCQVQPTLLQECRLPQKVPLLPDGES